MDSNYEKGRYNLEADINQEVQRQFSGFTVRLSEPNKDTHRGDYIVCAGDIIIPERSGLLVSSLSEEAETEMEQIVRRLGFDLMWRNPLKFFIIRKG